MTAKDTSTWSKMVNQEEALLKITAKCLKISSDKDDREEQNPEHSHLADRCKQGEKIAVSGDKRKCVLEREVTPLYGCQNSMCPRSALEQFTCKSTRSDHESSCSYRSKESYLSEESSAESEASDRNTVPYDHDTDSSDDAQKILAVTGCLDIELAKANDQQSNMKLNEVEDASALILHVYVSCLSGAIEEQNF